MSKPPPSKCLNPKAPSPKPLNAQPQTTQNPTLKTFNATRANPFSLTSLPVDWGRMPMRSALPASSSSGSFSALAGKDTGFRV